MGEIILNRYHEALTKYNNTSYILVKNYSLDEHQISLNEILFLMRLLIIEENKPHAWDILWAKKIDYLEELISQFGKKYPIMVDSFNYFVGLAENAISYFSSIRIQQNNRYYIQHKTLKLDNEKGSLYDPINIIFDYQIRDIAEYLKNAFFLDNTEIYQEFSTYLNHNILSQDEAKMLVARLLYPSFYFNLYEEVLNNGKDETIFLEIIKKLNDYERYLNRLIEMIRKRYDVDEIKWLKK